jgi:hypothetical protein
MQQLEIKYFFPFTEQIDLELDYKPCNEFEEEKRKKWLSQTLTLPVDGTVWSTTSIAPTYQFKPNHECVGYWGIGDDNGLQVWRPKRPNWLHQHMTKIFFGWNWKDK